MPSALEEHFVEVLKNSGNRISGFQGTPAPATTVVAGSHHLRVIARASAASRRQASPLGPRAQPLCDDSRVPQRASLCGPQSSP